MKSSVCLCTDLLFPDRLVGEHTTTASGARKKNYAKKKKKVLWFTTGKQCLSRVETTIQLKDCLALVWATMALFRSGPRPQVAAAGAQVAWPGAWACGD